MSLEDLGNIGEFVAAVGVIISLIYLALQIRQNTAQIEQNTRSLKAGAYQAVAADAALRNNVIIENQDVAAIVRRGLSGEDLSPDEGIRFQLLLTGIFRYFDSIHYQHSQGMLDEEQWYAYCVSIRRRLQQAPVRLWWRFSRDVFSASFRKHVEKELDAIEGSDEADA
jgi:hypothetical protein